MKRGKAHGSSGVVSRLGHDGMFDAFLTTGIGSRVAVAHGGPGPIDSSATAREEEVVVGLVILARGATTADKGG